MQCHCQEEQGLDETAQVQSPLLSGHCSCEIHVHVHVRILHVYFGSQFKVCMYMCIEHYSKE